MIDWTRRPVPPAPNPAQVERIYAWLDRLFSGGQKPTWR